MSKVLFSFGIIADIQCGDKDDFESEYGMQYFRDSLNKMKSVISNWNQSNVSFTIQLGDIIDGNTTPDLSQRDLELILDIFSENCKVHYHVLGNHCLKVPRSYLLDKLNLEKSYYDFVIQHWRFIVLDSTEISVFGGTEGTLNYKLAMEWLDTHPIDTYPNSASWNGMISEQQLNWLEVCLEKSKRQNERVMVFSHHPIVAEACKDSHLMWNSSKVLEVLEKSRTVVATFSGHYHPGGYHFKNGIHHVVLPALLDCPKDITAFACVDVSLDFIEIRGEGMVPSRICKI